jgi:hypothetical protein
MPGKYLNKLILKIIQTAKEKCCNFPFPISFIHFTFLILLLLNLTSANAQFSADVKIPNDSAYEIGDRIPVQIITKHPKNFKVQWPALDLSKSKLELLDSIIKTDTSSSGNEIIYTQNFNITGFDSGAFYFPSLAFKFNKNGDTTKYTVNTDSVRLQINTLAIDTTQTIKPIKPPVEIPYTLKELIPWILGGLGAAVAIVLYIWYLRKRKKKTLKEIIPVIPSKPAYEEAHEALEKLKAEQAWKMLETKIYYTLLSDILRRYTGRRWNIETMEHTTDEIIENAEKAGIKSEILNELRELLREADLVKFAKAKPEQETCYNTLLQAENFIENTKPVSENSSVSVNKTV